MARSVLRHRISVSFNGQAEGLDAAKIVDTLLDKVPANGEA